VQIGVESMGLFDFFKPNVEKMINERDIKGLARILENEVNKYQKKDKLLTAKVVRAIGDINDEAALRELISYLILRDFDLGVDATEQVEMITKYGPLAVNQLIPLLEHGTIKDEIIFSVLVKIGDKRAIDPIIKYFENGKFNVHYRRYAIKALIEFKDRRTILPSIKVYCALPRYEQPLVSSKDVRDYQHSVVMSSPDLSIDEKIDLLHHSEKIPREIKHIEETIEFEKEIVRNLVQFNAHQILQVAKEKPDYTYCINLLLQSIDVAAFTDDNE